MNKSKIKKWLLVLAAFFVIIIFCVWPTNYVIDAPGQASPVSSLIKSNSKYNYSNFYFVTVSERPAVMIDYLTSYLRPYDSRYTQKQVRGNASSSEYNEMQKYYMSTSENNAIAYAAKKAQVPYQQKYLGVYVMSILPHSNFKNKLQVGDTIVAVNNTKVSSIAQLQDYIKTLPNKTKINLKVLRNGKLKNLTGKISPLTGTNHSGIGIQLVDHTQVTSKPSIRIDAGNIGGPSAGLMFSLACYQIFTHEKLSTNKIAGTGTIDENGHVGMIGGIDKKVVAADKKGIKVFFAPTDQPAGIKKSETNYSEAVKTTKKIHSKMKIIPVNNFDDALSYIKSHKN